MIRTRHLGGDVARAAGTLLKGDDRWQLQHEQEIGRALDPPGRMQDPLDLAAAKAVDQHHNLESGAPDDRLPLIDRRGMPAAISILGDLTEAVAVGMPMPLADASATSACALAAGLHTAVTG